VAGHVRRFRYLDKLVDELVRGKAMEKILRTAWSAPHLSVD
jgi:hypothetical protein